MGRLTMADFEFVIEKNEVLRLLGYRNTAAGEEIQSLVEQEIRNFSPRLSPCLIYEKLKITAWEKDRVQLQNGVWLDGLFIAEKLKKCDTVAVYITTLGEEIERQIEEFFDSGDYLEAMILEQIAAVALQGVGRSFWVKLTEELKESDYGITSRLSPGDTDWNMQEQDKLFACVKAEEIGVSLTESHMMFPLKSVSGIYGFGKGIGITRIEHVCSECRLKECVYRQLEMDEIIVHKGDEEHKLRGTRGSSVLEVLRGNGLFVDSPCGGNGSCGKCKIRIPGEAPIATAQEREHLSPEELKAGIRLACETTVAAKLEIYLDESQREIQTMTGSGNLLMSMMEPDSGFAKIYIVLGVPSLSDQRDDLGRIAAAVSQNRLRCSKELLGRLAEKLRDAAFDITACIRGDELLDIEKGDTSEALYGIAFDLGTTTLAAYLMDLRTGRELGAISRMNQQRAFGADVINRIGYASSAKGVQTLSELVLAQMNEMIAELCGRYHILEDNIYHIVAAGNTAMLHFLLALPTRELAVAPFIPTVLQKVELSARETGLSGKGIVTLLPGIAGFVGSDITAGILASGMQRRLGCSILLDLGTNGEIAAGNRDRLVACATAAGPAFEGANIKCGMGGVNGAISKVELSKAKPFETIGGENPAGICGSGVLDMMAELLRYGIVDETGRMADAAECSDAMLSQRLLKVGDGMAFSIAEAAEGREPIEFTQRDVREIQLAKAAIHAGIQVVLNELSIDFSEVEQVYIGGGFGNFMDTNSAVAIGLIPFELRDKISSIGNCAGAGAKLCLLSRDKLREAEETAATVEYIELSSRADFQDYYIEAMMFDETNFDKIMN